MTKWATVAFWRKCDTFPAEPLEEAARGDGASDHSRTCAGQAPDRCSAAAPDPAVAFTCSEARDRAAQSGSRLGARRQRLRGASGARVRVRAIATALGTG